MPDRAPDRLAFSCPPGQRVPIPQDVIARATVAYDRGQYLEAFAIATSAAPLHAWQGAAQRVFAARLAARLGGDRLAALLYTTAFREDPNLAITKIYYAHLIWSKEGPLAAWQATSDWRESTALDPSLSADFLALRSRIAASYRDWELAWQLFEQASSLDPDTPWLAAVRCQLLSLEDREQEALECASEGLERHSWHRPLALSKAHSLLHLLRHGEALAFLTLASSHLQSPDLIALHIATLRQQDDPTGLAALLDRYAELSPLIEPRATRWLAGVRCELAIRQQDLPAATHFASLVDDDYHRKLATRLALPDLLSRRVRLSTPHVIQRHNTCAPSTLAMLAGFFSHEASHDSIADAICYDGTYDHTERQWCVDNGFHAREFKVTWPAVIALIDAGLPFALGTVEVESGHLQTVVGYDLLKETILIQDPSSFLLREVAAEEFLANYALHGPRGLAIAPPAQAEILDQLDLPEAALYDLAFQCHRALYTHRREDAARAADALAAAAPDHRLAAQLRWAIAAYDDDEPAAAQAAADLAALFPDEPWLVPRRAQLLRSLAPRPELLEFLTRAASGPKAHPVSWRELAIELAADARQARDAGRWLRKAHAALPHDARIVEVWADRLWDQGDRAAAADAYGFASSSSAANEYFARRWFNALYLLGRREEAIDRLRRRHQALGQRSALPARTLLWTLDENHLDAEAAALLDAALEQHPHDGPLLLDAARYFLARGEHARVAELLDQAAPLTPRPQWCRVHARSLEAACDSQAALAAWQETAAIEPTSTDAHAAVTRLVARLSGDQAALAYLDGLRSRFPHHLGLLRLRYSWVADLAPHGARQALEDMLAAHPTSPWTLRELAFLLTSAGDPEAALPYARSALEVEPSNPSSHGALATVLEALDDRAGAVAHFTSAIQLDADYTHAHYRLVALAKDASARREVLDLIQREMLRQVLSGAAIDAFRDLAFPLLEPEDLLGRLAEIHAERPDLFESWTNIAYHLADCGQLDEAIACASRATARFALLPGAWLLAARLHRRVPRWPEAIENARTARRLNPHWPDAWLSLADYLEDAGDPQAALDTFDQALVHVPDSPHVPLARASLLWRLGQRDAAFEAAMATLSRHPANADGWLMADGWADAIGRSAELVSAIRTVCADRPGESSSWLLLGKVLPRQEMQEKLSAIDRAIALDPRQTEPYDLKAFLLSSQGRYAEAEAACHPPAFAGEIPYNLLGRAAWVLHQRGDTAAALTAMERLLALHPDYLWGWQQLADWASSVSDATRAQTARQQLARLAPNDINNLCSQAELALEDGQVDVALELFDLARSRAPSATRPLRRALQIRWQQRRLKELRHTAASPLPGPTASLAALYLALADSASRPTRAATLDALPALITSVDPLGDAPEDLEAGLEQAGLRRHWRRALDRAARAGTIGMAFAPLWVRHRVDRRDWGIWKYFPLWIEAAHERAVEPISTFFDLVGKHKMGRRIIGFLSSPAAGWCKERTWLVGKVGYALTNSGCWSHAATWLEGIEGRDDAEGWLCLNATLTLLELGRDAQAVALSQTVADRHLEDETWPRHHTLLAINAAIAGEAGVARALLEALPNPPDGPLWNWLWHLASTSMPVLDAPPGKAARAARRAQLRSLRKIAKAEYASLSPTMRRWHRRTLRLTALHAKGAAPAPPSPT